MTTTNFEFTRETELTSSNSRKLKFSEAAAEIAAYILRNPDDEYEIAVGTDSMTHDRTKFVMAITVHHIGKGGFFYWRNFYEQKFQKYELGDKMFAEAQFSVEAVEILFDLLKENGLDFENTNIKIYRKIHVDVGNYGKTKKYVQPLVGMVENYGYDCEIKPNSYAASTIANKFSK